MNYTIKNNYLSVTIDSFGSELISIKDKNDHEYLWQKDEKYWRSSSPVLFPFVARLKKHEYYLDGKKYIMDNHGFAKNQEFAVKKISASEILFYLKENEETLKCYPRKFYFEIRYKLIKNELLISHLVRNDDKKIMYFGLGGHPGFNVPINKDLKFNDYYIEYENNDLKKVIFSKDNFVEGLKPFYLKDKKLPLKHKMFDDDAIVLKGGHKATLKSDKAKEKITIEYPDMDYFGIWHRVKTRAKFVCLEPWLSLPANKKGITVFEEKEDLIKLKPKKEFHCAYSIKIN